MVPVIIKNKILADAEGYVSVSAFVLYGGCAMSISLTEAAANRVRSFLANRGKGEGLRLGVRTSGCSGMAYVLEFADVINDEDTVLKIKV